ncbi:hypothetical protein CYLTODRAFT_331993, partial [Cylindrobasidium torrendii FP15055 ss-10]
AAVFVSAESHKIHFNNKCGRGTPAIYRNFQKLNNGNDYTHNGRLDAAIAYLDTGCAFQGDGCGIVEMTLINGGISSTDISLIPNHKFSVPISFKYTNGCTGSASCGNANCPTTQAFHKTDDYEAQRQCNKNDVSMVFS